MRPMYKPNYELTPNLVFNIARIERLYGRLESMELPKKLRLNLEKANMIHSSYYSNKIEGNQLSQMEVTNLIMNDRTPVNRDEKEVVNYFDVLSTLEMMESLPMSVELIMDLHQQLFAGLHGFAGVIRDEMVAVGRHIQVDGETKFRTKHLPPYHARSEIIAALKELITWHESHKDLPVIVRAGLFHHQFLYLHPFEDGNGRVCRILTNLVFYQSGYAINKYFVLDDYYDTNRDMYSDKLHAADEGSATTWLEYFAEGVKYSLESALARVEEATRTLSMEERPTDRERDVMDIVLKHKEVKSGEVAKELSVSRQQAHALLRGLVDKGLLERVGTTKSSYYRMA